MQKTPPRQRKGVSPSVSYKPRIGLWDIETSKQTSEHWQGMYEIDVINILTYSHMIAWTVKELDGDIKTRLITDYPLFKRDRRNDKALVKDLYKELSKYDILIAHNGDRYDIKYTNARFAFHGIKPLPLFKTIDTCLSARKYFFFPSNKLNDLLVFLGYPPKVDTGGHTTWDKVLKGDRKAIQRMREYNAYDVIGLEKVYKRLLPFLKNHPNLSFFNENPVCKNCGGSDIIKRRDNAFYLGYPAIQMSCKSCGTWFHITKRGKIR